ncbi:serine hydrolase domain-containing protein [Stappia indica]|uniref:serine hydrolase domain-containing protein n=1 Tax=Stappia indica TaxID=538381 RepID=UPI001D18B70F|nr:serine hydrolase domain-containing protein [Stappia indica]MCC4246055.1 beta-lactamase family protein [Stappia indica]
MPEMEKSGRFAVDEGRLDVLSRAVEADIARQAYDGMAIGILHEGRVVMRRHFGFAEREADRSLGEGDVFSVMSFTKVMTALAIFRALERGDLSLGTRIAEVIPEFAAAGKQRVTVAQLLSHTGGMPFTLPGLTEEIEGNLRRTVELACRIAPVNRPGEVVSYSAQVSYDVLGVVAERVDPAGRRFGRIIEEDIFAPLGMTDSAIGMPERLRPRWVPVVARNPTEMNLRLAARDRRITAETELPGGGGFSTLADMLRFAAMLASGGALEGASIVSPASLALATANHTGELPNNTLAAQREMRGWEPFPAWLGLGFFLRGTGLFPTPFGHLASPRTFGSIGAGSMVMWVDPERSLSAVLLSSGLMDQVDSHLRFQRLSDIIHSALRVAP